MGNIGETCDFFGGGHKTMKSVSVVEDANPHTHKATMETEGLKTSIVLLRKAKKTQANVCLQENGVRPSQRDKPIQDRPREG
jgi:hypothetical protein